MLARGMSPGMLTRVVSALNDCITERVIELELARAPLPEADFCWIALGSEGRLEQTLCTDQDNGIVFEPRSGRGDDEVRAALVPIARRINAALTRCGFPACSGGVMAGNPTWCLSAGEWRRQFQDWMEQPDPRALLNASIFFDLRPVHGHRALALGLQAWLAAAAPRHARFLALMTENALERTPPLGLFGGLVVASEGEAAGTLDLKLQGITPFVDAARALALAHGCRGPGTEQRLREVGERLSASGPEVEARLDALRFVQVSARAGSVSPPSGTTRRPTPSLRPAGGLVRPTSGTRRITPSCSSAASTRRRVRRGSTGASPDRSHVTRRSRAMASRGGTSTSRGAPPGSRARGTERRGER